MTAVQVPLEELLRWVEPPALDRARVEHLSEQEVERLLLARFRAFVGRDLHWTRALLLAVTPDS